jgi:hypothetical protein
MTKEMALRRIFLPIAIKPSAIALHVLLGGTPPKFANLSGSQFKLKADHSPHLGRWTARLSSPKSVVQREQLVIY